MNDRIDPSLCLLSYTTVDDIAMVVAQLGKGALLTKVDIESAYCLIPAHPQEHPLQAGIAISTLTPLALAQH